MLYPSQNHTQSCLFPIIFISTPLDPLLDRNGLTWSDIWVTSPQPLKPNAIYSCFQAPWWRFLRQFRDICHRFWVHPRFWLIQFFRSWCGTAKNIMNGPGFKYYVAIKLNNTIPGYPNLTTKTSITTSRPYPVSRRFLRIRLARGRDTRNQRHAP